MNPLARASVAAILAALTMTAVPADAQKKKEKEAAAPKLKLTKEVQTPLAEVQKLHQAQDFAGSVPFLDQADAVPTKTADDTYLIGMLRVNAGIGMKDNALIEKGIEQALASGKVSAEDQPKFLRTLGSLALQRGDFAGALTQFDRYLAIAPTDAAVMAEVAELHRRAKNNPKAVAMMRQAIETQERTTGAKADESWYRRALAIAYDSNLRAETVATSEALVKAYPNPTNWRDVVVIWRESNKLDDQTSLDALRLQRAASALTGERDYYEFAETASMRGLPGESKAVVDEGVAAGALQTSKPVVKELSTKVTAAAKTDRAGLPAAEKESRAAANGRVALGTADAYLGYGEYQKAAELYRLALQKGGVDAAVVNTRLGIALARSGDAAGADAAFALVTTEPRAQLAKYWRIWNQQKSGGAPAA
jgi:tetratricopeptide (TPR) repeat protein